MFDKGKTMISMVSIILVLMLTIGGSPANSVIPTNPAYNSNTAKAINPESADTYIICINKNAKPRLGVKKNFSGFTGKNNLVNAGPIYKNKNKKSNSRRVHYYGHNRVHMKTYEQRGHHNNAGDVYTYDDVYRLTNVKINVPDPTVPNPTQFEKEKTFNFDKLDNIMSIVETQNEQTTTKTTQINPVLNQYENFDGWGLSYDLNGNTTQKSTQSFTYNYRNQVIKAKDQTTEANYKYDALGRRIQKAVTVGSATKTTNYYYSGNHVIEERDGSDNVLNQYIYGNGIDEILRMDKYTGASSTPYYFHTNGIGSVTAITDANGDLVERVSYDTFGMPTFTDASGEVVPKSTIGNTLLFHGRRYDAETNLYYYRARYYDPIMGRFLQTDPLGYQDSMNLYQGFNMNPVNFVDPLGKWALEVHEEITKNALGKIKVTMDYWNIKQFRKGLIKGSKLPDIPEGYLMVGIAWLNHNVGRKIDSRSYRSHYGDLSYWHSMRFGNQTSEEVKAKIKFDVVNWIVTARTILWETMDDRGLSVDRKKVMIEKAGMLLGMALHVIEDSYAIGHTERDEDLNIVQFFDYEEQQKTEEDRRFHAEGDKKEGNEFYFDKAVEKVITIMQLFDKNIPNSVFRIQLEQLLEQDIFILKRGSSVIGNEK